MKRLPLEVASAIELPSSFVCPSRSSELGHGEALSSVPVLEVLGDGAMLDRPVLHSAPAVSWSPPCFPCVGCPVYLTFRGSYRALSTGTPSENGRFPVAGVRRATAVEFPSDGDQPPFRDPDSMAVDPVRDG